MKKTLAVFALTYLTTLAALTAADSDIVKGFDFTGSTSVTGAKLNQLVDNAYVGTNRGMIIFAVTNTAAAVAAESKLARYIWLDSSFNPPVPKVWNTSGFWTNVTAIASIAANSVVTTSILDGAVTEPKLGAGSVVNTKLGDNSISSGKIQVGSITNSHIAFQTIQSTNIGGGAILTTNIGTAAVTGDKIAPGSVGLAHLTNGFALRGTDIASATITSANIAQAGVGPTNLAATPTALYLPRVNGAATGFEFVPPGLVQMVSTSRTDLVTCTTQIPVDDTVPTSTEGDEVFTLTITPKSAASKLLITFSSPITTSASAYASVSLQQDASAASLAASAIYTPTAQLQTVTLRHVMTSGTTSATTFKIRVGPSAAVSAYLNGHTAARIFGGVAQTVLTIQEIY